MGRTLFLPTSFKIVAAVGAAFVLWGLLLAYASSPAYADTIFKVNSTGDQNDLNFPGGSLDGSSDAKCDVDSTLEGDQCTLRAAIQEANVTAGEDTIDIGVTGTVNLTGVLPDLSSNIKIEGPGADKFTVRRDTGGDYRIFHVAGGTVVSISGITISDGIGVLFGGGVFNEGSLTIGDSTISNNSAICDSIGCGGGGGIGNNEGNLTISDSTISGNTAPGGSGGGVDHLRGTLTISDSTISGNSATSGGGVLSFTLPNSQSTITNSTISGNTAGGSGGGVHNSNGLTVINNSTITNNTAGFEGGGVDSPNPLSQRTEVLSSIISANTASDSPDVHTLSGRDNAFRSKGYNLIGDGNATEAFLQTGDRTGVRNPELDPLDYYGGPTKTHRLQSDSLAIDKVPPIFCTPPVTDQRGVTRPQGPACDIGAFELDTTPPSVKINKATDQDDPTSTSPIHFTAVFSEPVTGFTDSDVALSGTAGANKAVVSGGPTTFDIAVSGMSLDGTVIATIPAKAAQDTALNFNTASASDDNTVDFDAPNIAPTVEVAAGGSCATNDRSGTIKLTVNDPDGQAGSLTLSATSSNTTLVPASNVTFGGSGASRTLTATALSGKTGTATLTATVSDGTDTGTVALTLQAGGNSNNTLTGTDPTPTLSGTDILLGQNGDDTLSGLGGIDLLCGARGNDRLTGGTGPDFFSGGSGTDTATDFNASQGDTRVGIP